MNGWPPVQELAPHLVLTTGTPSSGTGILLGGTGILLGGTGILLGGTQRR